MKTENNELFEIALETSKEYTNSNTIDGLEHEIITEMIMIYQQTMKIRESTDKYFSITKTIKNINKISATTDGILTLKLMGNTLGIISDIKKTNELSPYVGLFVDVAEEMNLISCKDVVLIGKNEEAITLCDKLNDFIEQVRNSDNEELKKEDDNNKRCSNKNLNSIKNYIHKLFNIYSRILVVRIDFGYQSKHADSISIDEIKSHRVKLLGLVKKLYSQKKLIGYIWKIEYGIKKKYHYHAFFLFNGALIRQDVSIANAIGELWNNEVTKNKGVYFNCNHKKEKYSECGIGMINYYEHNKISYLHKALSYITKIDSFIKIRKGIIGRTLGKSEITKNINPSGRTRKKKAPLRPSQAEIS